MKLKDLEKVHRIATERQEMKDLMDRITKSGPTSTFALYYKAREGVEPIVLKSWPKDEAASIIYARITVLDCMLRDLEVEV